MEPDWREGRRRAGRATVLACAAVVVVGAAAAVTAAACARTPTCHELTDEESFAAAKVACTDARARGDTPTAALDLAFVLMNLGEDEAALPLAQEAYASRPSSASLRVLGTVLTRLSTRARINEGRAHLEEALRLAEEAEDANDAARSALALAGSYWRDSRFDLAEQWVQAAESADPADERTRGITAMLRGDLERRVGGADDAERSYQRAEALLRKFPSRLPWSLLKRGRLHLERGALEVAAGMVEEAAQLAAVTGQVEVQDAASLVLAEVALQRGQLPVAREHLDAVKVRVAAHLRLSAMWLTESGELAQALALLEEALASTKDKELVWDFQHQRGRVLEALGSRAEAEDAYRASIEQIEDLRGRLDGSELQPWVLARRSRPYEALFRLLANRGATTEVLQLLESLTARSFLDFVIGERVAGAASDLSGRASQLQALRNGLVTRAGTATDSPLEALVVIEADGRIWTVHRAPGRSPVIEDRADSREVRALQRKLEAAPDDLAAAARLGELLLPESIAPGDDILRIVPSGELLRLPWAALRRKERPLVLDRPVAIAPSLALVGAMQPATWSDTSLVLGDPDGTLPAARAEARAVGELLGAPPREGGGASRGALYDEPTPWLLHIASHAAADGAGSALQLADGSLTASEVLEAGFAARVAVLSGCATAKSKNREMWGSLAVALLANGTGTVVATLRSVDDVAAGDLVTRAYAQGLRTDPVRALAAAQREMIDRAPVETWSSFVAYDTGTQPD